MIRLSQRLVHKTGASQALAANPKRKIAGWYIPSEIDNAKVADQDGAVKRGNEKLKKLVGKLGTKPVAISGFFREGRQNMPFKEFSERLEVLLKGTGIKVFIFQDGVGVEDSLTHPKVALTKEEIATLQRRYECVAAICKRLDIRLWVAVELMIGETSPTPATTISRLISQLDAARVEGVEKVVGFSSSHHLTPLGGNAKADELFRAYYKYVNGKEYKR